MTAMPTPADRPARDVEATERADRPRWGGRDRRTAGLLLSIAGVAILMGSITAEALHPGHYTTHADTLSHLGASEPPNSVVVQPSAAIFDGTMPATGVLILAGAWFTHRALRRKAVTVPTALLELGVLGVGVLPLTKSRDAHDLRAAGLLRRRGRRAAVGPDHPVAVPAAVDRAGRGLARRHQPGRLRPGLGAGGGAGRGRDRAVELLSDRAVAGRLRQPPHGHWRGRVRDAPVTGAGSEALRPLGVATALESLLG